MLFKGISVHEVSHEDHNEYGALKAAHAVLCARGCGNKLPAAVIPRQDSHAQYQKRATESLSRGNPRVVEANVDS